MKDRITHFLISENISSAEFADKIGVQRSSVSHVLNGRNYPGASFIQKMLMSYPNLNPRWLLLGEGTMLDSQDVVKKEPSLFSYPQPKDISADRSYLQRDERIEIKAIPAEELRNEKQSAPISSEASKPNDQPMEVQDIIGKSFDNKDVERIVLFFSDKTFTVYTSSK